MNLLHKIVEALIARAKRTPYTHLYHADGTPYMRRYWLMPLWLLERYSEEYPEGFESNVHYKPKRWVPFAVRLHHIITADYDRHFHDHPWPFVSLVLRGGYVEHRPIRVDPCFVDDTEAYYATERNAGSIAYRRATDRHRISRVCEVQDCWTLVAVGRKRHWWGFYTPQGKVYFKDYPSVHGTVARSEIAS